MGSSSSPSGLPPMDLEKSKPPSIFPMKVAKTLIGLFSSDSSRREPPASHKTKHARFITIAVSHYCEKVRWGLDLLEADKYGESPIYYTEDGHAPAFANFATLPASDGAASVTPMLVFDDGRLLFKSDAILRELCPFLYPEEHRDEIMALEDHLGETLGTAARCAAYWTMLDPSKKKKYYDTLIDICCPKHNTSDIEHTLTVAMMDKGVDEGMMKALRINAETASRSFEEVRKVFREVSDRVDASESGYLVGDRFTAADLTFASLVYFVVSPPEMDRFVLPDRRLPPEWLSLCEEVRRTSAGAFALRMYAEHRGGEVVQKSANRNRKPVFELLAGLGALVALGTAIAFGLKRTTN